MRSLDRNPTLYSLAELETMQRIWSNPNANKSAIPLALSEIEQEIDKRKAEDVCYHSFQDRVRTHRGYHCGKCGKKM